MTPQAIVAGVLLLAVVVAAARLLWTWRRDRAAAQPWRLVLLLCAQPALAALLYLTLYPPQRAGATPDIPTVLVEGADAGAIAEVTGPLYALPEAPGVAGTTRVADLATVLRQHPGARRVRVIGAGLPARDLDAAQGIQIEWTAPELPRGLRRVQAGAVVAGGTLRVSGQVGGVPGGQVELRDPAGRRVDGMPLPDDGGFALSAVAHAAGVADFALRVLDAEGGVVETASVPVWITPPRRPRVLLLAGAPQPETRALLRWMQDAGFEPQSRIALGGGVAVATSPAQPDYARIDLLLVDARAWDALGEAGRARAIQAVANGMGLLLRSDAALPATALRALRGEGFTFEGGSAATAFRLAPPRLADEAATRARLGTGSADAPADIEAASGTPPELARRDLRVSGAHAVPLLRDAEGNAVAWWRAHEQGRIGVWTPVDTWRLPLAGRRDLYADLWNAAFAALSRPYPQADIRIPAQARAGERMAVCGIGDEAYVVAPDGTRASLLPDRDADGCAAFWPATAGWHQLHDGDLLRPFHVLAREAMPGVRLAAMAEATARVAASPGRDAGPGMEAAAVPRRTSSWPWFACWLLLAAAVWWFERSRAGRGVTAGPA